MGILCCKCRRPPKEAVVQDGHTGDDGPAQTLQLQERSPATLSTSSFQASNETPTCSSDIVLQLDRQETPTPTQYQQSGNFVEQGDKSEPGTIYIAMFDLDLRSEKDGLMVNVGDRLRYISTKDVWFRVKNLATEEIGYIPSNFLREESSIDSFIWFYGMLTLKEAEKLLLDNEMNENVYLVTERKSSPGSYTLSYKTIDRRKTVIRHKPINQEQTLYYITGEPKFHSVKEVVERFQEKHLSGATPCIPPEPTIYSLTTSDDRWTVSKDSLDLGTVIASGNFGVVHKGTYNGRRQVAIKVLKKENVDETLFNREVDALKQLQHENVVCLLGICLDDDYYIVTELMKKGSLLQYLLTEASRGGLGTGQILIMAKQIAAGMRYLESKNFVHRDLAARNVLLGEHEEVKVGDLGMAREITEGSYSPTDITERLPYRWCAPETLRLRDREFTHSSDVWSFAIVLVEMFQDGDQPYTDLGPQGVMNAIKSGTRHKQPPQCPPGVYHLMLDCWKEDPAQRPSFHDLYERIYALIEEDESSRSFINVAFDSSGESDDEEGSPSESNPSPEGSDRGSSSSHKSADEFKSCYTCPACKIKGNENDRQNGNMWDKCVACEFWFHRACVTGGDHNNEANALFYCDHCRTRTEAALDP